MQSAGLTESLPSWLRFGIAIATLVWLPGLFVERMLGVRLNWPGLRLPFSFFLGASVLSLVATAVMLLGGSFALFRAVIQIVAAGLFLYALIRPDSDVARVPLSAIIVATILAMTVSLSSVSFDFNEDAYDHIGYLRHIVVENSLEPRGVLAAPLDHPDWTPDPRKGAFHGTLAAVFSIAELESISGWAMLPRS